MRIEQICFRKKHYIKVWLFIILMFLTGCSSTNKAVDTLNHNSDKDSSQQLTLTTDPQSSTGLSTQMPTLEPPTFSTPKSTLNIDPHMNNVESDMIQQFIVDSKVSTLYQADFLDAIHGNFNKMEALNDKLDFSLYDAVFQYGNATEGEVYFNIGTLYYQGINDGGDYKFASNKKQALQWYKLSTDKGYFHSAIYAGDMLQAGDGVTKDYTESYKMYEMGLAITPNGVSYGRLGDCYYNGYGTNKDIGKALEYYRNSAFCGDKYGLYMLSKMTEDGKTIYPLLPLQKAASSLDYDSGYFEVAYGGLDSYSTPNSKGHLIDELKNAYISGKDPSANNLKNAVSSNKYFPADFVSELSKAVYSYSYYSFVEQHGVKPSMDKKTKIKFAPQGKNDEFSYDYQGMFATDGYVNGAYLYDFDGDGNKELYESVTSGAGGAFQVDGVTIFKKNKKGEYEEFAGNCNYSLRDGVRLIKYNGRYYFVVNPFSDSRDAIYDIDAFCFDKNGNTHTMHIKCSNYSLKKIATQSNEEYVKAHNIISFLRGTSKQAVAAIAATKKHILYSPKDEKDFKFIPSNLGTSRLFTDHYSNIQDLYFSTDILNDGNDVTIQKGHVIVQDKYYFDLNNFNIYLNKDDLNKNAVSITNADLSGEYFGLHSSGNIYSIIPVSDKIVQLWTGINDGTTYCMELSKIDMVYTMRVFVIKDKKATLVSQSLYFDQCNEIKVSFEF